MAGFIELIAKIKPKNNGKYPLVDDVDVEMEDGSRLSEAIKKPRIPDGGTEGQILAKKSDKNGDAEWVEPLKTEDIDKKLESKLDKNLGSENSDKVLITDAEGNIITQNKEDFEGGGGTTDYNNSENKPQINGVELKGNKTSGDLKMYTQEEVDDLLYDKMDKPYKPITITDDITIEDCLDGHFKINKILGNTYQNVETDIKPTPERPVPINSRKVKANGEYVELRSLKESKNLFDKNIMAFTSGTLKLDGTVDTSVLYAVSGFVPVRPSTQYTIKVIDGFRGSTKVYYDINKQVISNEATITFTTPSNCYFVRWQTATTDTRVLTEEDIQKINDEMMMVKGNSLPSSYVAPTVRDYKIVDHVNKTAKIVRNVRQRLLTVKDNFYKSDYGGMEISLKDGKLMNQNESAVTYCNLFNHHVSNTIPNNLCYRLNNNYLQFNYEGYNEKTLWDKFITDNELYIQYQLATPTEESITYVETDTNEVGYSWQDTTSPSPTIKSEVKGVEEIDILKTGKNLFDVEKAKDIGSWDGGNAYKHFTGICFEPNTTYTFSVSKNNMFLDYKNEYNNKIAFYIGETIDSASPNIVIGNSGLNSSNAKTLYTFTTTDKPMYLNLYVNKWDVQLFNIVFDELLQNVQIEVGDTATDYEPYTEQRVNIALPRPIYQDDVVNIESGEYEHEDQKYVVTGDETFFNDYQTQTGFYGRYFNLKNGNGVVTEKIWCNYLSYIRSSWELASEGFCQNANTQIHLKFSNDRLGITDNTPVKEKRTAFANYLKRLYTSGNPLYVVGKVAKTTQPIPEDDLAKLKSLKTEQGVTNIFVSGEVKPTIEARYALDIASIVSKLQTKLLTLQEEVVKNV